MKRILAVLILMATLATNASAGGKGAISLDVHGAQIADVLQMLAMQSGMNLVTDRSVGHQEVTLRLENVTFSRALAILAHAYDLQVRREGNILIVGSGTAMNKRYGDGADALGSRTAVFDLHVASPDEVVKAINDAIPPGTVVVPDQHGKRIIVTGDTAAVTRVHRLISAFDAPRLDAQDGSGATAIPLRYARSSDAEAQLKGVLPPGSYVADQAQNAVIITGGADTVATARAFLRAIDVRRPQVLFEVRVADISTTKESNVGALFGGASGVPGSAVTTFANNSIAIEATLNALVSSGRAKVLARPRIVTQNNSEASLLVGETYPVVTLENTGTTSNQSVKYIDIGVKLRLTPTIGADGTITAELHPEYSELLSLTSSGFPVIGNRKIDATLRVRNDETIVLGGLLQDTDAETVTKVPLLGDVPVFGEVFRNRTHRQSHDEIVFLIKPHIL